MNCTAYALPVRDGGGRQWRRVGPCFILQPLIESQQLVRLLPDWGTWRLPIHVVYPTRRHLSAKVQAMTSFLADWFEKQLAATI